jgi:uncharacterized DUF497 family protein
MSPAKDDKPQVSWGRFEWDKEKEELNVSKHGFNFKEGSSVFLDPDRIIIEDLDHSESEERFYCIGMTATGVLTTRFTWRGKRVRILGVGAWRKGRGLYEEKNKKR